KGKGLHKEVEEWGWRAISEVKGTGFSCRGAGSVPSSHMVTHTIHSPSPRRSLLGPSGACGTHTNQQAKPL
ncbi:mCG146176, partial [Mus musculus]